MAGRRTLAAGGPAANAAITFGFLGGRAKLISAMGAHPMASIIHQDLGLGGVELIDLAPPDFVPVISSILVTKSSGNRTVVSSTGPALKLGAPADVRHGADFLLVDGHYLPLAIELARHARSMNVPVILDGGSWKPNLEKLLEFVDIAVCSGDFHPPGATTPGEVIHYLHHTGIEEVAITRGERPVRFSCASGACGEVSVRQVDAVDTLGAGDIFHGAFCYA
jgi:sugar/nucleoside kinase (ribokinase family)